MAIQDVAREEINAARAKEQATQPPAQQANNEFLRAIAQDKPVTVEPDSGATYLGRYAIPAEQWKMWAAAAGYPGARWDDPLAQQKVAGWVANELFTEFQDWGLVAIGWRYGAGTARRIRDVYGGVPGGDIVEKLMGKAGVEFLARIQTSMAQVFAPDRKPYPAPQAYGGGDIQLKFTEEEMPEAEEPERRGANPAHTALQSVLGAMADRVAGGKRLAVEEIGGQQIPMENAADIPPPTSVTEEETEYLGG
jgi:hypothetical protein